MRPRTLSAPCPENWAACRASLPRRCTPKPGRSRLDGPKHQAGAGRGPEPDHRSGPEPGRRAVPEPGRRSGPEPGYRSVPEPGHHPGPEPGHCAVPESGHRAVPEPGRHPGPSHLTPPPPHRPSGCR
ncbi:MAG: hypothetical protein KHX84_05160 [Enterocloster asparagiformis]|nr:hypothetical protein [Enterocloster asparagiformis]